MSGSIENQGPDREKVELGQDTEADLTRTDQTVSILSQPQLTSAQIDAEQELVQGNFVPLLLLCDSKVISFDQLSS